MIWTRSQTLALAQQSCVFCHGLGLRPGRGEAVSPCNCVFRAIFRACHARFRRLVESESKLACAHADYRARGKRTVYGFKNEEYMADFVLIARRTLGEESRAYKLFKFHFLLGADWRQCAPRLGLSRGEFFHECYRIQQQLGRAFRETEPYALFPLDEYFSPPAPPSVNVFNAARPLQSAAA